MRRYLIVFVISIIFLSGCDVANDLLEFRDKQERIQKTIKDSYGWNSKVGWKIQNGILSQVTVMFMASDVKDEKVSNLEAAAKNVILDFFDTTPKSIYIQIVISSED